MRPNYGRLKKRPCVSRNSSKVRFCSNVEFRIGRQILRTRAIGRLFDYFSMTLIMENDGTAMKYSASPIGGSDDFTRTNCNVFRFRCICTRIANYD